MNSHLQAINKSVSRITMIDALRGFALSGIVLLHQIEHFNFFAQAIYSPDWLKGLDQLIFDGMFFLFGGKAFALFSLMFGFSFHLQFQSRRAQNQDYGSRFIWRMVLLFGFGMFHTIFYGGDILFLYALLSFPLYFARNWQTSTILICAIILLLSPLGIYNLVKDFIGLDWPNFHLLYPPSMDAERAGSSFLDLLKVNFQWGLKEHFVWGWNNGRIFVIPGLFLLGLYIGRCKLLTDKKNSFWLVVLFVSLLCYIPTHFALAGLDHWLVTEALRDSIWNVLKTYGKFSFMLILLAGFILFWRTQPGEKLLLILAPFGRMGLTNYVLSSAIGTFLYHGWGLGLYQYCGATLTLVIALISLAIQIKLSSLWLQKHSQGPLEHLWRKLTWINSAANPKSNQPNQQVS